MDTVSASRTSASFFATARRHTLMVVACAAVTVTVAPGPSFGQTKDPVIARIAGSDIRLSDLRLADEDIGKAIPAQEEAERREYLIRYLSDLIILSKAAKEQNLGDEAEIKRRMEFARSKALMESLLQVTAQAAATNEAVRKVYDDAVKQSPTQPELRLRSILFKFSTPDDAEAVAAAEARARAARERIAKGEDFAEVAKETSDNDAAKTNGGDMGYLSRLEMGKEYADVAFTLKKGSVSDLIKTSFGWHIIKVEDERMRKPADFDIVREKIAVAVGRKAQLELVNKLRAAAAIERLDSSEKPAQAGK